MATASTSLTHAMMGKQPVSNSTVTSIQPPIVQDPRKSLYQAAVQVKFLHLEAEIESLLLQLQTLKKQQLATAKCEPET